MSITRELNSREKRRLRLHGIVPVDSLDPSCTTRELIENNTTHLYRYGCFFQDVNVELEELTMRAEKSSSRFRLRGFHHHFHLRSNFYLNDFHIFISLFCWIYLEHFWRNLWHNISSSLTSLLPASFHKDSFDEDSFIFEPIFVVCSDTLACVWLFVWILRLKRKSNKTVLPHFHDPSRIYLLQKLNHDGKYPQLIPPNPPVRSLLLFQKDDQVIDSLVKACERLNIEVVRAKNAELALELFQNPISGGHHLVIVDGRCKNIDVETFGR